MTPQQKPEWIKISEKDRATTSHSASRGLPIIVLIITAAIIGVGAVFGQSSEQLPASAVESLAPSPQVNQLSAPSDIPPTVASNSSSATSKAAPAATTASKQPIAQKTTPTVPTIKNPMIGTSPAGGNDDRKGDDDDHDD